VRKKEPVHVTITKLLKKFKPATTIEFARLTGYTLDELGEGEFRLVYRIHGTNLVLKFPKAPAYIEHSRVEAQRCYDIMHQKKWYLLRRYVPKVYHYEPRTGVILMKYYDVVTEEMGNSRKVWRDILWIQALVGTVCVANGLNDNVRSAEELDWVSDIGVLNLGVTPTGYKFLDMGLFEIEDDLFEIEAA
jgi:hypothetical protein